MKKIKIWLLLAASVTLLCGCGKGEDLKSPIILDETPISTESSSPSQEAPVSTPTDTVVEDDTNPPHEGMLRSKLTNEWVEADVANTRPIAVMTPNEISAVPHYNLSKASVLYEANVEARMTRLMAVYEDWQDLEKIGNVRSLRTYYAYWSFEWDAFLIHAGGPLFIDDLIAEPTTQNINGNVGGADGNAYFRSTDRKAPHNLYATGSGILSAVNQKGYSLEYRGMADDNHYNFTNKSNPNTLEQYGTDAKNATYIDMSGCYPLTRCYFEYNEDDGLYYRSQHLSGGTDGPHIDAVTGEQLSFKNILIQNTKYEELGEGYLVFQCHDTTRDGWYFTNGKGIHVNWEKSTDYSATRYYDDKGNEIVMNTGKTMVCIVEDGDSFTYR